MTKSITQIGTTKVTFRIPTELYERIKSASEFSGRPMNSEVITWLEYRDIAAALDEVKQQNEELRRLALDTLEAVNARR